MASLSVIEAVYCHLPRNIRLHQDKHNQRWSMTVYGYDDCKESKRHEPCSLDVVLGNTCKIIYMTQRAKKSKKPRNLPGSHKNSDDRLEAPCPRKNLTKI